MMLWSSLLACVPECVGPGCASAWPASRLLVVQVDDGVAGIDAADVPDRIEGALEDGADWVVAAHGATLVLGAPERGAVIWADPPDGAEPLAALEVGALERPGEDFGRSLAVVDSDGDGVPEVFVGAPFAHGDRGAVRRYPLGATDPDAWTLEVVGGTPADHLGAGVFPCGDVTGDGLPDVAVSAPYFVEPDDPGWRAVAPAGGPPPPLAGAVFLLRSERMVDGGSRAPWELGPVWWGAASGDGLGAAVECRADLDADGLADLVIGAPWVGPEDAGQLVWVRGGAVLAGGGPEAVAPLLDQGSPAGLLGAAVRAVPGGVAVGAPASDGGVGEVALVTSVDPSQPVAALRNPRDARDRFGAQLQTGDVDGDGRPELLVGAPDRRRADRTNEGRTRYAIGWAWVYPLGADGAVGPARFELRGDQAFGQIGRATAFADVDGDGRDELLQPMRAAAPER